MDQKSEENFISLADASKQTGYHQDYLGFLCRTGKLKGFKIGRNWVTTKEGLDNFVKNYKNGISEAIDETGQKIPVHVEVEKPQGLEKQNNHNTDEKPKPDGYDAPSIMPGLTHQVPDLHHLRKDVLEGIEQRVKSLSGAVRTIENKILEQGELLEEEQKILQEQRKAVEQPAETPVLALAREPLEKKFSPALDMGHTLGQPVKKQNSGSTDLGPVLSAEKLKQLYSSFQKNPRLNLSTLAVVGALSILGFISSVFWSDFTANDKMAQNVAGTQIIYRTKLGGTPSPTGQIINNFGDRTINQLLGLNQSQVLSLIDSKLSQYLSEGKFKGQTGAQGPQGPAGGGSSLIGGPAAPVTIINSNPQTGFGGGTLMGVTIFSADTANIGHLSVGDLTAGNCLQAGSGGRLTTTSLPCGSGSGGGSASGTAGTLQFSDGAAGLNASSLLFWDNSTSRLGVGTSTPAATLSVQGSASVNPLVISSSTGSSLLTLSPGGNLTLAGNLTVTGTLAVNSATTTINGATYSWPSSLPLGNRILQSDSSGSLTWVSDQTGGGGSVSGGLTGFVTTWASSTGLTYGRLIDNGTVAGVNATSSTITFNLQGSGGSNDIFDVSSSTGISVLRVSNNQRVGIGSSTPNATLVVEGTSTSPTLDVFRVASSSHSVLFGVAANGSTTFSSLTTGPVYSTSGGGLYNNGTTGTGITVQQTSPTLVTPILGVASGTSLSISGILWGNGQTNLTTASATALTVSGNTVLASTTLTGTFSATGSTTLSSLASGLVRSTSGGGLYIGLVANADILNSTIDLAAKVTGVLPVINGGTGTTSAPTVTGQLLMANGASWGAGSLAAGSNITITTSTPGFITIASTDQFQGTVTGSGAPGLAARWTSASALSTGIVYDNGTVAGVNATSSTITFNLQGSGGSNDIFDVSSSTGISVLRVSNNQRVGIGSSTPNATLVVEGTSTSPTLDVFRVASSSHAVLFNVGANGNVGIGTSTPNALLALQGTAGSTTNLFNVTSSTQTSLFVVRSNGNVGVGTTTANALLAIQGASAQTSAVFTVSSSSGASFFNLDANGFGSFQPTATSTTAYLFYNAAGLAQMTVDTTNGRLQVGNGAGTASPVLVVLDAKNTSGDPAGVNGAMYYNSNMNKMRCYVNSTWTDCGSRSKNMNILNASVLPDSSGNVYFEPFTIVASSSAFSNPFFKHGNFSFLDSTTKDCLYGLTTVPKDLATSTTPTFTPVWTASSTSGNIVWEIAYRDVGGDDATVLNSTTAQVTASTTDAAPSAIFNRLTPSINASTTVLTRGDTLEYRFCRDGSDSSDTMSATATLQSLLFNYDN